MGDPFSSHRADGRRSHLPPCALGPSHSRSTKAGRRGFVQLLRAIRGRFCQRLCILAPRAQRALRSGLTSAAPQHANGAALLYSDRAADLSGASNAPCAPASSSPSGCARIGRRGSARIC
jgi:hypothetical protein